MFPATDHGGAFNLETVKGRGKDLMMPRDAVEDEVVSHPPVEQSFDITGCPNANLAFL